MSERYAVVGAGAVGATAAFDLALRDADVTLFERGSVASGSTGRAAGICYDAFADQRDAEIAGDAVERFRTVDDTGEFEFHECPYVWLAREGDDRREAAIREQVPRMQEGGVTALLIEPEQFAERFPSLRADDVAVAAVAGAAGYADPESYARTLAVLAKDRGAALRTDTEAAVRTDPLRVRADGDDERFDRVLVAAGAHTRDLLSAAGHDLAVKPYRVQAATAAVEYDGPMVYDATGGLYVRPHPTGLLAGDGTEERAADPDAYDRDADAEFADTICDRVADRAPAAEGATPERAWAGLCTATPDRDPLVGHVEDGLYVATGFQGHGFMRAPAIAERVAKEMLGEGDGIEGFDPARFDGDEDFEISEGMLVEE